MPKNRQDREIFNRLALDEARYESFQVEVIQQRCRKTNNHLTWKSRRQHLVEHIPCVHVAGQAVVARRGAGQAIAGRTPPCAFWKEGGGNDSGGEEGREGSHNRFAAPSEIGLGGWRRQARPIFFSYFLPLTTGATAGWPPPVKSREEHP